MPGRLSGVSVEWGVCSEVKIRSVNSNSEPNHDLFVPYFSCSLSLSQVLHYAAVKAYLYSLI